MFIKDCSKQYAHKYSPCLLLTESYRDEKGVPQHRVIMNLSKLPKPLEEVIVNQVKGKEMVSLEDICQEDNRSLTVPFRGSKGVQESFQGRTRLPSHQKCAKDQTGPSS